MSGKMLWRAGIGFGTVIVISRLLGAASSARAGEASASPMPRATVAATAPSPAPAATAPAPSPPAEPRWYERFEVGVALTGVVQAALGGGEDSTDANAAVDFRFTARLPSGTARVKFWTKPGEGLNDDLPSFGEINDTAGGYTEPKLKEAWYEHYWLDGRASLKVGQIDMVGSCGPREHAFDGNAVANDEWSQFLAYAFVNNLALELPERGAALVAWGVPHERASIGLGLADADGDWEDVFDRLFGILELDLRSNLLGRPGNYRFYGWLNDRDHTALLDPTRTSERGWGVGLSLDQEVADGLTLFARYGWQRGSVYKVEHALSLGLGLGGGRWGRPDDALGLAYGIAFPSGEQRAVLAAGGADPENEHLLEIYYRCRVYRNFDISPHVQWLHNAGGDGNQDDVWTFGLRGRLVF